MELSDAITTAYIDYYKTPIDHLVGKPTQLHHVDTNLWILRHTRDVQVAKFFLREFPNCSAMTIAYGIEVAEGMRGKGLGKAIQNMRMLASKLAGYSAMTATVRDDNEAERHILSALGWNRVITELTSRHGGTLSVWMVKL